LRHLVVTAIVKVIRKGLSVSRSVTNHVTEGTDHVTTDTRMVSSDHAVEKDIVEDHVIIR
jgi:hypothetical protein